MLYNDTALMFSPTSAIKKPSNRALFHLNNLAIIPNIY